MKQGYEAALMFGEEVLKDRVFGEVYGSEVGFLHCFFHIFLLMEVGCFYLFLMQNRDRIWRIREKK